MEWTRALRLVPTDAAYAIELDEVPKSSGIYVFGRVHTKKFEALYVGRANNIRARVKTQFNNLKLMHHLDKAKTGVRILLAGSFVRKSGQRDGICLPLLERALIRYFVAEGHDLVNIQGKRLRQHTVLSTGKHPKRYFEKSISLEK